MICMLSSNLQYLHLAFGGIHGFLHFIKKKTEVRKLSYFLETVATKWRIWKTQKCRIQRLSSLCYNSLFYIILSLNVFIPQLNSLRAKSLLYIYKNIRIYIFHVYSFCIPQYAKDIFFILNLKKQSKQTKKTKTKDLVLIFI